MSRQQSVLRWLFLSGCFYTLALASVRIVLVCADSAGIRAEALQIRRELAQKNPETYRPDVATTLNNLGNH